MQDGEQLVRWTRTEEDPRVVKHCWLSVNQTCHPALERPNTKLGLINRRKVMQQLLFYWENKTWCSALVSFGVSTAQSTLALFSRMIVSLDFAILSSEDLLVTTCWMSGASAVSPCPQLCCTQCPTSGTGLLVFHSYFFFIFIWKGGPQTQIWQ